MDKKPSVDVTIDCPSCKALLNVKVYKTRIGEPEPVEYDIETVVSVDEQGRLFVDDPDPNVTVEEGNGEA